MVATLLMPATAAGHASFLEGTPGAGERVERSPGTVALAFTEPINTRATRVRLLAAATADAVPARVTSAGGRRIELRPAGRLERGSYRVRWRSVSSVDGHVREGFFSFGVGAAAGASQALVAESPLARSGWIRVAARTGLYLALLVFAGGLLLRVVLGGDGHRSSWLVGPQAGTGQGAGLRPTALRREHRALSLAGWSAAGLGLAVALAEGADAVGGLALRVLPDYLLANGAGLARLAVPALVLVALSLIRLRQHGPAALMSVAALGAVAASGHAAGASPPEIAVASAWVHLISGAVWLGGIVLLAMVWGPKLRELGVEGRRTLAAVVLPRFGRVALWAFLVVVTTGTVNSLMELGDVGALWSTAYGRVLLVKIALVLAMAAVSLAHARRLRPRVLAPRREHDAVAERRHWRLVRGEPLLGAAAVIAVAFLVGFPTPPRELERAEAQATTVRACSPCPVPVPQRDELSTAAWTGREIVAAWIRRRGPGLEGEVRVYERSQAGAAPSPAAARVVAARQRSCGRGCTHFQLDRPQRRLAVEVRGRPRVTLPSRWEARGDGRARRLVQRAFASLRAARSVRLEERVASDAERGGHAVYRLQAPNRMTYQTKSGMQFVLAGRRQWIRPPDAPSWQRQEALLEIPFTTANWLRSPIFVQGERLLGVRRSGRRRVAEVAYVDSGTPGWGTAWIDMGSGRVERVRMLVENHTIDHRYSAYNRPERIALPEGVPGDG